MSFNDENDIEEAEEFNFKIEDNLIGDNNENNKSFDKIKTLKKKSLTLSKFASPDTTILETKQSKQTVMIQNMDSSVEVLSEKIKEKVLEEIFNSYNKEISKLQQSKLDKKIQIFNNYHSQILENEMLIRDDDTHVDIVKSIILNLEEERDSEYNKLEIEYEKEINEKKNSLTQNLLTGNKIKIIEEKFKYEMFGILSQNIQN